MRRKDKHKLPKNELCADCGTDLEWWFYEKKRKIYYTISDEYFCSKKCLNAHYVMRDYEVLN